VSVKTGADHGEATPEQVDRMLNPPRRIDQMVKAVKNFNAVDSLATQNQFSVIADKTSSPFAKHQEQINALIKANVLGFKTKAFEDAVREGDEEKALRILNEFDQDMKGRSSSGLLPKMNKRYVKPMIESLRQSKIRTKQDVSSLDSDQDVVSLNDANFFTARRSGASK
jgi:hypothetical protein